MKTRSIVSLCVSLFFLYAILYEGIWRWGICRIYVPEGKSLLLMFRGNLLFGNPPMAEGDFAKVDEDGRPLERGFLKEMVGPGRHFDYDPIHYEHKLVQDTLIAPGSVGLVESKLGKALPPGEFLVDGNVGETQHKGILRKVLTPGRYRINEYGYDVKVSQLFDVDRAGQDGAPPQEPGWLQIPPGYVGVVTNFTSDPLHGFKAGIQDDVLPPGLYAINPKEQKVDVVEIGYRETSIKGDLAMDRSGRVQLDENGEPVILPGGQQGITFPSNDGFGVSLDFTAIWGILPDQAPKVVKDYGNVSEVESKVIMREIGSICRIEGSKLGAIDLLAGESREKFQSNVSDMFRETLLDNNLSLQVGLVRHIYIPAEVRQPKQKANIADETKLTRDMEIETAKVEADLEQAKAGVEKEAKTVVAETEKLYQEALANGRKEVEEIKADTERQVATIARKTAETEAQSVLVLGKAQADVETQRRQAQAQKFQLAVEAFGSPQAYNQWTFANGLPSDLRLILLYAGEGTFWTDLKGFQEAALGKLLESRPAKP